VLTPDRSRWRDIVMHSATKVFERPRDVIAGSLTIAKKDEFGSDVHQSANGGDGQ